MKVGLALKPGTGVDSVAPYVALVDMVLVMTVEPGFGGQSFMPNMMPKVLNLRTQHENLDIQVDGGLSPSTVDAAAAAGANLIVAGSAVFKPGVDPSVPINTMRSSVLRLGRPCRDGEISCLDARSELPRDTLPCFLLPSVQRSLLTVATCASGLSYATCGHLQLLDAAVTAAARKNLEVGQADGLCVGVCE